MTYKKALKVLNESYMEYIPSAASWLDGLHDLWEENRDAFLVVAIEWKKRWESHSYREVCATCRLSSPGSQDEVWCGFSHTRYNKGFWCPLWEDKDSTPGTDSRSEAGQSGSG